MERLDALHHDGLAADEGDRVTHRELTADHAPGHDGAQPLHAMDAFDGHQERAGLVARGFGYAGVQRVDQRVDVGDGRVLEAAGLSGLEGPQGGAADDGYVGVTVALEELGDLHLHQLEELGIGDVDLVDEDDQVLDADLPREDDVLARLRLRALRAVDEQDAGVHLGGAGDHALHVLVVTGAVDVGVEPRGRRPTQVRGVDGDPALALRGPRGGDGRNAARPSRQRRRASKGDGTGGRSASIRRGLGCAETDEG